MSAHLVQFKYRKFVYMEKVVRNKCYMVKMEFLDCQQKSQFKKFLPTFYRSVLTISLSDALQVATSVGPQHKIPHENNVG